MGHVQASNALVIMLNDVICFACIMVWCLENKHLGFASVFIFNKYLSFTSTIISPQQTIIQQQHIIPLTVPFKIYPLCAAEKGVVCGKCQGPHVFLELKQKLNHSAHFLSSWFLFFSVSCFAQYKLSMAREEIAIGEIWKVPSESIW